MTLQELYDAACLHSTAMADAMRSACLTRAYETGEALDVSPTLPVSHVWGKDYTQVIFDELTDWRRMAEGNSDTRLQHV